MNKMKQDIIIEEILFKKITASGNSAHIIVQKRFQEQMAYVLIIDPNVIKPLVHYDKKKKKDGKTYLKAEISLNTGTHGVWIEKKKIPQIFTRARD